jgi:hypothetical protein
VKIGFIDKMRMFGKIVIEYEMRGCMAETHVLKNVWELVEFGCQTKYIPGSQKIYMARCRLIQSRDDVEPVWCNIPTDDIYPLELGALGQPLGYAWRR